MLAKIRASEFALDRELPDPTSPEFAALPSFRRHSVKRTRSEVFGALCTGFAARFASIEIERVIRDITRPLKKALGNAYKRGNRGDPAKNITLDIVFTLDGFVLSDGSILLGDQETRELRVFSRSGEILRTFAGRGQGPGELRFLHRVSRQPGDTIAVSAWPFGFLSRFAADGEYVDSRRIGPFWPGRTSVILGDGSLLLDYYDGGYGNNLELWAVEGEGSHFRASGHLIRAFEDGRQDTLRHMTGEEWFKSGVWRRDLWLGPQPFGPVTLSAVAGDRVYVGETSRAEIEVRHVDGTIERVLRWETERVGISSADRDRIAAAQHYRLRQPDRAPHVDRWLAAVVYPDRKPPFAALLADAAGHVWVHVPTAAGEPLDRWIAFADDGPMAEIRPPAGSRLLEIGALHVLLVRTDALDVERVELRPLNRNRGASHRSQPTW